MGIQSLNTAGRRRNNPSLHSTASFSPRYHTKMKNCCVIVLVLLSVAQTAFLWPLEDILSSEADFHPVIITNERADRYVRSLGSPKKRAVGFGAVKEKSVHAGQKALSTRSLGRHHQQPKSGKKAKQNGQAQQQPKAAHKERRQDKKNNKKTPAKRVASANTSSKNIKMHKAAVHHK